MPTSPGAALLLLHREALATASVLREEGAVPPRLLAPLTVAPPGAALGTQPCIGDYSGDGLDDLAWRSADGRVWVSVAGASPGWSAPQRWGRLPPGTAWDSVRSGDFNADGRTDLVIRNPTTGNWRLLASTSSSFAPSVIAGAWPTSVPWTDVVQGDFDGDGGGDLAGRDPTSGIWVVSRGTPSGFDTRPWVTAAATATWQHVRAADFDGDGRTDIVGRNPFTGNWRMLAGDGSGFRRSEVRTTWPAVTMWTDVMVGDFDGDGCADLAGRDPASQLWTVSRGAVGTFTTAVFGGLAAQSPWQSFVATDFDGDGRTDIAARNAATGNWRMLPSTGTAFGRSVVIGTTPGAKTPLGVRPLRLAAERTATGFEAATPGRLADLSPALPLTFLDPPPAGGYSSAPRDFTRAGARLFFVAEPQRLSTSTPLNGGTPTVIGSSLGRELCVTDGTPAGTRLVRDINPFGSANISSLTAVGDRVFFVAADGTAGYQIWTSDGTEAGTFPIMDRRFEEASRPSSLTAVGSTLFFVAADPLDASEELWTSDGTRAGTTFVKDVWPESWRSAVGNLVNADGTLMFTAYDPTVADGLVSTIWQSDGTAAGTVRMARFPAGTDMVSKLVPAGGRLFAVTYGSEVGTELWALDAGATEARLVRDIRPGVQGSSITSLTSLGGGVVFSADDGITGPELWWSDGTEAGTRLVLDIQPRAYDQQTWTPPVATSRATTRTIVLPPSQPWVTAGSQPGDFTVFNGRVVFTAFDETHGRQVWSSDGTAAGTWRLSEAAPMPAWWRQTTHAAVVGRQLCFSLVSLPTSQWPAWPPVAPAASPVLGLWRTDGSANAATLVEAAAVMASDIRWTGLTGQQYVSVATGVLASLGSSLIFSGSDAGLNNEPWILKPGDRTSTAATMMT
ncbi:MAG: FG-GAP-like repeat-containing protein [Planctomycetaceae bacterium]